MKDLANGSGLIRLRLTRRTMRGNSLLYIYTDANELRAGQVRRTYALDTAKRLHEAHQRARVRQMSITLQVF